MSTHSFSSLVAQLNEAQAEAVRSMGFASFLKVDLKHIPGKFSKWLIESFDLYAMCFRLPDGKKFSVTAFDVYATLGVPLGGTEIIEITKSSTDEEYDEVEPKNRYCSKFILKYVKDMSLIASLDWCQFILDKLITSVRHYKDSTAAKEREAQGFHSDVMKEAVVDLKSAHVEFRKLQLKQKANNDLCAPSFSPTLPLDKPDGESEIPGDTLVSDASIIIEKEDHRDDVVLDQPKNITKKDDSILSYSLGLGLSQPDSQSSVPQTTSVPDLITIGVNENDGGKDDNDDAPLRFPLRNTSQVNYELSMEKSAEKNPKKVTSLLLRRPVEHKNGSPKAYGKQETIDSRKPKLTNKVLPEKYDKKHLAAARTPKKLEEVGSSYPLKKCQPKNLPTTYYSPHVIWLTKLDSELSQDELAISEMFSAKLKMWMIGNISNQPSCMISGAFGKAFYCAVKDQRI
ncbi:hypothetical protein Cgig2_013880 [Carnegiea gigantea]|uniref:Uncharacterized protein n=1 Tax=Carnegiea gigantea TaxID=171969 RepID=A0A9Q1JIG8_9CARY|nr:hypothetical protein Cgig2_013880 [Carnegiea gigantea]